MAQHLSGKINTHVMQNHFIIEEGMMAIPGKCFRKREASMF